jgi:glycosyltransferase involved in cell wall biosynthesis
MKVIIAIPAYNEERDIARVLSEIKSVMDGTSYRYQILVFDDGSRDKTVEIARSNGALVVSHKRNAGLAQTFRDEMKECLRLKADVIVHTDADGQYPAAAIPALLRKIEEGFDLVLGSRFLRGGYRALPLMKRFGNKAFAITLSQLTGVRLTDTTTGFRAFTSEVARDIDYINTFTYTQEQIIKAAKQKFKIAEIPIVARRTRPSRLFKGSFQYAAKAWINILRIYRDYEPLAFFGRVGGAFIVAGGVIGLWLVYRFVTLGQIGRLPSTILSMLFILTGIQVILFGFLADSMKR